MHSLITSCMHRTCKSSRVIYSDVVEAKIVTNLPFINHIFFCALLLVVILLCVLIFLHVQGVGLKLEDALAFWKAEFSQRVSMVLFEVFCVYVFLWLLCICIFFVSSITSWKQMATANVIFNYGFT